MTWYQIVLPYWKQGDDLAYFLNQNEGDPIKALQEHAEMLRQSADKLDRIADLVSEHDRGEVEIEADTHVITVDGSVELMDKLIELDLISCDKDMQEEWEEWNSTGLDGEQELGDGFFDED